MTNCTYDCKHYLPIFRNGENTGRGICNIVEDDFSFLVDSSHQCPFYPSLLSDAEVMNRDVRACDEQMAFINFLKNAKARIEERPVWERQFLSGYSLHSSSSD